MVVFYASDGSDVSMSFKLEFPCSNNEAECFAYMSDLCLADEISRLFVRGNSRLIIKQINGEFMLKEIPFVSIELLSKS